MPDPWQDFFVAQVGASAAILGLLFVSISLNLDKILSFPLLPRRALLTLLLIFAVLLISLLLLIPGQPSWLRGTEVMVVGGILSATGIVIGLEAGKEFRSHPVIVGINILLSQLSALPYLVGALLMLARENDALYWIAAGMIISFIKAVADTWVLLVEINR